MVMLENVMDRIQLGFKPDNKHLNRDTVEYRKAAQLQAFCVGLVALSLPFILFASIGNVCFYDSISHFYYAPFMGNIFFAAMIFIGTVIIALPGKNTFDRWLTFGAGNCAYLIAIFPTSGKGCSATDFPSHLFVDLDLDGERAPGTIILKDAFQMVEYSEIIHLGAAASLFVFMAFYCFFVFTIIVDEKHCENGKLKTVKKWRNSLYRICGAVISFCILAITLHTFYPNFHPRWNEYHTTFWLESAALISFGFAWIIQGRLLGNGLVDEIDKAKV